MEDTNENKNRDGLWDFMKAIIVSLLIVLPIRAYVAQPFVVEGFSMEPNYKSGEYLIIDEFSYHFRAPRRGDVIVFKYPKNPSEYFIKRVIGLPGDTVELKNGEVMITPSGLERFVLKEFYLPEVVKTFPDVILVLEDQEYFVLGDNRAASSDSRVWGTLPAKNIVGRSLMRLFPLARAGFVAQ